MLEDASRSELNNERCRDGWSRDVAVQPLVTRGLKAQQYRDAPKSVQAGRFGPLPLAGGRARMAERGVGVTPPAPSIEECRYSSREGTPTGWASLREFLFALGPLGPEVGMGADGSPLERRVSEKAAGGTSPGHLPGVGSKRVFLLSSPLLSGAIL